MKYYLYDQKERRLVLVDEVYPTIAVSSLNSKKTPNSKQERAYNSLYIWENVELREAGALNGMDHTLIKYDDKGNQDGPLIILPSNDCYLLFGGGYIYNQ